MNSIVRLQSPTPSVTPLPRRFDTPEMIDLEVNGVTIGATLEAVLDRFGKPLSVNKKGTNPCGEKKLIVRYADLAFTFNSDENGKNFKLILTEITSSKWEVAPTIRIGATIDDVRARFGQSRPLTKKSGLEVISYLVSFGDANFYFRNGKLVKVDWNELLCFARD